MRRLLTILTLMASGLIAAQGATAHGGHNHGSDRVETRSVSASAGDERARAYFTDTVLVDHTGRSVKFYSDVLEGRTVVISFIFTTCPDACPLINATLERVQDRLRDRIGKDIVIVSITVDPENDTVAVLSDYRKKFKAMDGWIFLTGTTRNIETVSQKLGQVFERDAHLTALLVGNTRTARWRKIPAHLSDAIIAGQIRDIADDVWN
ncbi:SCO family protein [Hyphomonas sp.]|uniref:SCO family protein n=1 Tax=Hyphomonas sp. TaxID=87 RepID=UPI00391D8491